MCIIFTYFKLPKVLFNFERQPSQLQKAPRRGEQKSEGCRHFIPLIQSLEKREAASSEAASSVKQNSGPP